jgi:hypothetical protein
MHKLKVLELLVDVTWGKKEEKLKFWIFFVSRLFGLITSIMFCIKFGLYTGIVWNLIAL